jgi:DNA-binding phage protein
MIRDLNKSLNLIAENDDMDPFLASLKKLVNNGKFSEVLKKTGMSKEQLQDILEGETDLYFDDLVAILKSIGYKITIEPVS